MKAASLCLLALSLAACTGDKQANTPSPQPAAQTQPAVPELHLDGYHNLRFGMTAAEVTQAWRGEFAEAPRAGDVCYYLWPKTTNTSPAFSLMIENGKLVRVDVDIDGEAAPGGGKVGMSIGDIRRRYGGRIEQRKHKYIEDAHYLRIKDTAGTGVLLFETDAAGTITAWRIGLPPQVDYVEGCS